tara:strand:- start:357 stop:575 length:219 start_codon:yes stop_codon:yes gene_type:complete
MSTNAYVESCPECGADTCLHNVSTRPPYHNWECWNCGVFYESETDEYGQMTEEERLYFKEHMVGIKPEDEEK